MVSVRRSMEPAAGKSPIPAGGKENFAPENLAKPPICFFA